VYAWLDFVLLEFLCLHAPELEVVVIGHDHPVTRTALRALSRFPNFSFLGLRPYAAVPAYLHAFDAGIIPFLRSPLTEGVNPVKLYEYSAAGLPIVATNFSSDLDAFRPLIAVCDTREEFLTSVRRVILLRRNAQHIGAAQLFARANDWQGKTREMIQLLTEHTSHSLRATTS
jgi:glycosyltransferase involved in cell wall biosynthesis